MCELSPEQVDEIRHHWVTRPDQPQRFSEVLALCDTVESLRAENDAATEALSDVVVENERLASELKTLRGIDGSR